MGQAKEKQKDQKLTDKNEGEERDFSGLAFEGTKATDPGEDVIDDLEVKPPEKKMITCGDVLKTLRTRGMKI